MQEQKNAGFFQTYTEDTSPQKILKKTPIKSVVLPTSPIQEKDSGKLGIILDSIFDLLKLCFDFVLKLVTTIIRGFKYLCWGSLILSVSLSIVVITSIGAMYGLGIHETEDFPMFQEKLMGSMSSIVGFDSEESLDTEMALNIEKRIADSEDDCLDSERFYRGHCISILQ